MLDDFAMIMVRKWRGNLSHFVHISGWADRGLDTTLAIYSVTPLEVPPNPMVYEILMIRIAGLGISFTFVTNPNESNYPKYECLCLIIRTPFKVAE